MSRLQLNLLPDIKMEVVKQRRARNLVISGAVLVSAACMAIFLILMVTVYGVQKKQLSNSSRSIETATDQLRKTTNLNRILTVQNQLSSLVNLHHSKHINSRIFNYLTKITPSRVNIGSVSLDYTTNTIQISGTANTQHSVNVFIDTLKFTTFKMGSKATSLPAFKSVVESSFGISQSGVSYSLNAKFDPLLFSNAKLDSQGKVISPILSVPNQTTTRSALNDPGNVLFNGQNSKGAER